jgi:hypothetical protein
MPATTFWTNSRTRFFDSGLTQRQVPRHSIRPNASTHGPLSSLRSDHTGCRLLLRCLEGESRLRGTHSHPENRRLGSRELDSAKPNSKGETSGSERVNCPRPTVIPASGIFQPENPQRRVRRATHSRYVQDAIRHSRLSLQASRHTSSRLESDCPKIQHGRLLSSCWGVGTGIMRAVLFGARVRGNKSERRSIVNYIGIRRHPSG